jgi:hypothetical protein
MVVTGHFIFWHDSCGILIKIIKKGEGKNEKE